MDPQWAPVMGAALGASAVLVSQAITWLSGGRRLKVELAQRDREAVLRYSEPLRDKWFEALEQFYELVQDVLENGRLSESDYLKVRRNFAYLDDELREQLLAELSAIARDSAAMSPERRIALVALQDSIRRRLRAPDI